VVASLEPQMEKTRRELTGLKIDQVVVCLVWRFLIS